MKWTGGKDAKLKAQMRLQEAIDRKKEEEKLIKNAVQGLEDWIKLKEMHRGCEEGCKGELNYGYRGKWYCSKCVEKIRNGWYNNKR
jgi:hypothetical protein